jgi:hypothetical protein
MPWAPAVEAAASKAKTREPARVFKSRLQSRGTIDPESVAAQESPDSRSEPAHERTVNPLTYWK